MKIVIPTYKRVDKQITFDCLPKKWQAITYFFVRKEEYNIMNKKYDNVVCLPEDIKNITSTRQYIKNYFKNEDLIFIFDDDLTFRIRNIKNDKWETHKFKDNDFDYVFNDLIYNYIKQGYYYGFLAPAWVIPVKELYPESENRRMMTNMWFYNKKLPLDKFNFDEKCDGCEDIDITMQLIKLGYKNIMNYKYNVNAQATNTEGGCETYRTIEYHNNAMLNLKKKWGDKYVKIRKKIQKSGPWKDKEKIAVRVELKKLYEDNIKHKNKLERWF